MAAHKTAVSLSKKLQQFHSTLPKAEQAALDDLLTTFGERAIRAKAPSGSGLVAPAGMNQAIMDVKKALPGLGTKTGAVFITPTLTTITITTTVASHPIITCKAKA